MIDPLVLLAFIPASLALNLTPGADMLFCIGQGLRGGARPAFAASAGISLGGMIHATLAGLGLGAAVAALPVLFDVIRWIGVGYLLWLAWGALRGPRPAGAPAMNVPNRRSFRNGLFVSLSNPKVVLFILAFVPQFIDPAAGPILLQFLIFGALISTGGFVINGCAGTFASRAGQRLSASARGGRILSRLSAAIFAGLALRLALLERA